MKLAREIMEFDLCIQLITSVDEMTRRSMRVDETGRKARPRKRRASCRMPLQRYGTRTAPAIVDGHREF